MDSAANSGSIQSSSGGDDNYDPRAAADSSFITPTFNPFSPPPPHLQTMYNYNPYNNNHNNSSNFLNQQSQTISLPPPHHHHFTAPPSPQPLDHDQTVQVAPNPKKRSRASRRAPTTVLTTDTSNFRAMVQEFTGITPSPSSSSSSSNSSHVINLRNKLQFSHQTLLLRPQKIHHPSYNNYNNMLNYYTNNNNNNNNNILSSPLFSDTSQQLHNPNIQSLQSSSHNIIGEEYGRCNNVTGGLPELISPENGNNYSENATIMKHKFSNFAPAATNIFEQAAKRMRESLSVSATRGTN